MIKMLIMFALATGFSFLSAIAVAEPIELSDEQTRMALQQIQAHRTFISRARPEDRKEIAALLSPENLNALADGRKQYTSPRGQCGYILRSSFFECYIEYTYQVPGDRQLTHPVTRITFTAIIGLGGEVSVINVKDYLKTN